MLDLRYHDKFASSFVTRPIPPSGLSELSEQQLTDEIKELYFLKTVLPWQVGKQFVDKWKEQYPKTTKEKLMNFFIAAMSKCREAETKERLKTIAMEDFDVDIDDEHPYYKYLFSRAEKDLKNPKLAKDDHEQHIKQGTEDKLWSRAAWYKQRQEEQRRTIYMNDQGQGQKQMFRRIYPMEKVIEPYVQDAIKWWNGEE